MIKVSAVGRADSVGVPAEPSFCQKISHKIAEIAKVIFSPFIAVHNWIRPINPVTQAREFKFVPTAVEKFIGTIAYRPLIQKSGGEILETDPDKGDFARLVREVGKKLAAKCPRRDLQFEFTLIDSNVDNAWCLPGGKIGINLGLILHMWREKKDYGLGFEPIIGEKIAAVLSHEITHAAARHTGRKLELSLFLFAVIYLVKYALSYFVHCRYDQEIAEAKNNPAKQMRLIRQRDEAVANFFTLFDPLGGWIVGTLNLCGSRRHELEADKYGMHLYANVQEKGLFDKNSPRSAIWLMHFFKEHHPSKTGVGWFDWIRELFSTHPTSEERLKANLKTWQEIGTV